MWWSGVGRSREVCGVVLVSDTSMDQQKGCIGTYRCGVGLCKGWCRGGIYGDGVGNSGA